MAALFLLLSSALFAKSDKPEPVGHLSASPFAVSWVPGIDHERIDLTIVGPDGTVYSKQFPNGNAPAFRLQDLGAGKLPDGAYVYELRVIPHISDGLKRQLAAARLANDDATIHRLQVAAGIDTMVVQSGVLTVVNGAFINSDADEPPGRPTAPAGQKTSASVTAEGEAAFSMYQAHVTPLDVVTADDEIIQGSLCVGLDCVNNESFGFDTIRLKENNTRIKFQDTSTSAGFPNNVWQLTANDSASGGANKFSIDDITGTKTPFTVTAGAPTNSLFVASSGKTGFGTGAPVLNLHITATDTPAIRQEQTSGGGFTAQTWDIGANEANWFVRDVTGGSRLPLRIRPGAPTSAVDINATGNVGVGTASPSARLEVLGGLASNMKTGAWASNAGFAALSLNGAMDLDANFYSAPTQPLIINRQNGFDIEFRQHNNPQAIIKSTTGNVGIGTISPTSKLQVVGLPVFANNAAAVAGGLTAGAFYRTGGDPDLVAVVH
jgi:hypothetical protein